MLGGLTAIALSAAWIQAQASSVQPFSAQIGASAPKLLLDGFIAGEEEFRSPPVKVVYFWGTWCATCRSSYPILSRIADRYQGRVGVLGVNFGETKEMDRSKIVKFVAESGNAMKFPLAWSSPGEESAREWNVRFTGEFAAGTAFIVDQDQRVVWYGSPSDRARPDPIEKALRLVLAGRWDMTEAKEQERLTREKRERLEESRQKVERASKPIREFLEVGLFSAAALWAESGGKEIGDDFRFKELWAESLLKGGLPGLEALCRRYHVKMQSYLQKTPNANRQLVANGYLTLLSAIVRCSTEQDDRLRKITWFADAMLKMDPTDPEKWATASLTFQKGGNFKVALQYIDKAIPLCADDLALRDHEATRAQLLQLLNRS